MTFSVIIPVYQVEQYIGQCIESVLNQSFKSFEVILVDDGSKDQSGKICDMYGEKDPRVHVIHTENGGLSVARNIGMEKAKGEFLWFLDSDDYMSKEAMQRVATFIEENKDIDLITCDHLNEYIDESLKKVNVSFKKEDESKIEKMNRRAFLDLLADTNGGYWAAWKNIYRREIVEKEQIQFPKGMSCSEDCDFFIQFVQKANVFAFLHTVITHYRINRQGSITNQMSKKALRDRMSIYLKQYEVFRQEKDQKMQTFFANKFANALYDLYRIKEAEKKEIIAYIQLNQEPLKDTKGFKYSLAKFIWWVWGYDKGSKILGKLNPNSR